MQTFETTRLFRGWRIHLCERASGLILSILDSPQEKEKKEKEKKIVGFDYRRSWTMISQYVHKVLKVVLMLHGIHIEKQKHVPNYCNDPYESDLRYCQGNFNPISYLHS